MVSWILKKILGSKNQREVKSLWPLVHRVNEVEAEYQKLSDEQLRAKTDQPRRHRPGFLPQRAHLEFQRQRPERRRHRSQGVACSRGGAGEREYHDYELPGERL